MFEIKPWKGEGCDLDLSTDSLSQRELSSREINDAYGGGGGLNASYRTVEAVAVVSNFIFKTAGGIVSFDFDYPENRDAARRTINQLIDAGKLPLRVADPAMV